MPESTSDDRAARGHGAFVRSFYVWSASVHGGAPPLVALQSAGPPFGAQLVVPRRIVFHIIYGFHST